MKIDKEFESLIPPLSDEEFKQLEENILKDGCRDSILVWLDAGEFVIVDGHNRYKICEKHNLPYNHKQMHFKDRNEVINWMILNQFGRRNLSAYDRSVLALRLKPVIQEQAKERMILAPQKKVEHEKKLREIYESNYSYDTKQNLIERENQDYAKERQRERKSKSKYIYFARFDGDKLKVGSSINPNERIRQLSVSCPSIQIVEQILFGEGAEKFENNLKKKFEDYRIGNECYQCSDKVLQTMIDYTKKESTRRQGTDYELAKIAGVSHDTIHKVEVIQDNAPERIKKLVENGEISINQGYHETMNIIKPNPKPIQKQAKERHEEIKKADVVSISEIQADSHDQIIIALGICKDLIRLENELVSITEDEDLMCCSKLEQEDIRNAIKSCTRIMHQSEIIRRELLNIGKE